MNLDLFMNLVNNILLVMSMALIYSVFKNDSFFHPILRKIMMGLMVGFIISIVMYNSYPLSLIDQGLKFDARAVLLSVSGMFFGLIPTVIGIITAIIIRIYQGGVGTLTGISWIVVSGSLGLVWRYFRLKPKKPRKTEITWIELYVFGLLIQVVMILLLLTLPSSVSIKTIQSVAFPLLIIFPIGSLFVTMFLMILRKQYFNDINTLESERQYRRLFTKNKANLMLIDAETADIIDVNESCIETYGYSIEEFKQMNLSQISVLSKHELMEEHHLSLENRKSFFEHKHIKKSGIIFDVEDHTSPIVLHNKEYSYHTIIDISDKVQSEKMFKDADERLKTTLLSVGEGVVVTDEHSRITLINQKALSLIGKYDLIERRRIFDVFRIYSNQSTKNFEDLFNECLSNNVVFRSDNTISLLKNDTDQEIFIDFTISPINTEHGFNHGAILVLRDITIEKERQEEIRFMSKHDYLTNLYNRFNFEQELMRLDTERQLPLSLIIGDINGLKLVNDAYGHLEGDKLIKVVAEIFKKATRSEDIVARWGGDEFAILLPQTSLEEASAVTNRVIDLCSKSMYEIIKPSVAIGIATKTNSNQNINEILSAAEEKMYTQKMDEGPKMRQNLLQNLLNTLNKKVTSNKKHTDNMENIIEQYCTFYNLDAEELVQCKTLARYHDIGRIIIDPEILNKVEPLSDSEWTKIKTHSEIGSRLIATIPELQQFAPIILQHHERFDGTGYPLGLKGNDISEKARLLTILDSYEAMTSDRVYRPTKTHDEAINEILRCTGTQFDPELVKKFIKIFEKANN